MKNNAAIHIGTSGWSYKHWKEIFYPKESKSMDWLSFYSNHFSSTEINSSFYHLPRKSTVESWVKNVPDSFFFCVKMSRYLTHFKKLKEPEETLEKFFEVFEPMQKKMGPVLVQLPPSLKFDYETAEYLYIILKKNYRQFQFAMEVRHETWMAEESLMQLAKYNIAFVVSQSGKGFPYAETITADNIYVRFHGPEQLYASGYDEAALQKFGALFKQWKNDGHTVWSFFNNDIFGHALNNANRLIEIVNEQ